LKTYILVNWKFIPSLGGLIITRVKEICIIVVSKFLICILRVLDKDIIVLKVEMQDYPYPKFGLMFLAEY